MSDGDLVFLDEAPVGWRKLLLELLAALNDVPGWDNSLVDQIKQKFGGLRFYYHDPYDDDTRELFDGAKVDAMIKLAEARAWRTCEICGSTDGAGPAGNTRGWIFTMCEPCRLEQEARHAR